MAIASPFGHWASPISAASAAAAVVSVDEVRFIGGELYWVEGRPAEGARTVLVTCAENARPVDVTPPEADVQSEVYGYGGGVYAGRGPSVWFTCQGGAQLWHLAGGGQATQVIPSVEDGTGTARYADLHTSPDGTRLVCVRERGDGGHTITDIVRVDRDGSTTVLVAGADFHAHPRLDHGGRQLAWLSWSDPQLPWDGTTLWVAHLADDAGEPVRVAGGAAESVLQPSWSDAGELYFLSDRSGWWNLYRWHDERVEPVVTTDTDLAVPPWELGYCTYALLPRGRIAVVLHDGPYCRLALHDPSTGALDTVELPYTSIKPYLATDGHRVALIGASPVQQPTVAVLDTVTGTLTEIAAQPPFTDVRYVAVPEQITIPTKDGSAAHGLFYPPANPDTVAPPGDRPPLIIRPHPGPTAGVHARLDPTVQFFTSRGIALFDLDYRGSSGYGRRYRDALNGRWGVLDAADCVDAADHLVATGRVDPHRIVISGASAGGYTALRALATTRRFAAGAARSAIADLAAWREAVPRFQRHHTTDLIGPWPEMANVYRQRSVLHDRDEITAPLLLVHGGRDQIAPIAPIERLAAQPGPGRVLLLRTDDGHTFTGMTLAATLEAELTLYIAVWNRADLEPVAGHLPS